MGAIFFEADTVTAAAMEEEEGFTAAGVDVAVVLAALAYGFLYGFRLTAAAGVIGFAAIELLLLPAAVSEDDFNLFCSFSCLISRALFRFSSIRRRCSEDNDIVGGVVPFTTFVSFSAVVAS